MTQQERANEVLDQLFRIERNARVGLSEKFLRAYAPTKWVGPGVQLSADVLICEINKRVWMGSFMRYKRGSVWFYRLNRHRLSYRKKRKTAGGNFGELPRLSRHQTHRGFD